LIQLGKTDAPIHHQFAVRADRHQVADRGSDWLIFGHVTGWHFGCATPDAVDFTGLAWAFVLCPFCLKKGSQRQSMKEHGFSVINRCEAAFSPIEYGIFVDTKKTGDIFNRIVAMNFDVAVVGVALAHDSAHREQHAGVWQCRKVHGGRVISFLEWADLTRRACHIAHPPDWGHTSGVSYRPHLTR